MGIQAPFELPNGREVWSKKYYHANCVSESTKKKLVLEKGCASPLSPSIMKSPSSTANNTAMAPTSLEQRSTPKRAKRESKTAREESPARPPVVLKARDRRELERELRILRKCFAVVQGCEDEEYKVFHNKTLKDIVTKLPTNLVELHNCWGIGPKRLWQYGNTILSVVEPYLRRLENTDAPKKSAPCASVRRAILREGSGDPPHSWSDATLPPDVQHATNEASADSDDEIIGMGNSLSVEEIVNRRVREAEARGEVLEIIDE